MQDKSKSPSEEGKIVQLIVFNLGDEEYAADISQVREVLRVGDITSIPDSPDFIKGVSNVRGEIALVIGLKALFALPTEEKEESKHIVVTEREENLFGLMVDEVTEVLRIPETEIRPAPGLVTRTDRRYINGILRLENRLMMSLDLTKVLSEEELVKLTEIRLKHRAPIEHGPKPAEDQKTKAEEAEKETGAEAQKEAESAEEASAASVAGKKRGKKQGGQKDTKPVTL